MIMDGERGLADANALIDEGANPPSPTPIPAPSVHGAAGAKANS